MRNPRYRFVFSSEAPTEPRLNLTINHTAKYTVKRLKTAHIDGQQSVKSFRPGNTHVPPDLIYFSQSLSTNHQTPAPALAMNNPRKNGILVIRRSQR